MVTVADLLTASGPVVLRVRGVPYTLGAVRVLSNDSQAIVASLIDPETGYVVPILWSKNDDAGTDDQKITLVTSLLNNAVDALTFYISEKK